jgi:hypothetical protein
MVAVYLASASSSDAFLFALVLGAIAALGAFGSPRGRKLLLVGLVVAATLGVVKVASAQPYKPHCESCHELWPAWVCYLQGC